MKTLQRLLIIVMLLAGCGLSTYDTYAVPASPKPVKVKLPDGTSITIRNYGDEWAHYTTTDDGYGIARGKDGFYYYIDAKGELLPLRAKNASARSAADRAAMRNVPAGVPYAELERKRQETFADMKAGRAKFAPRISQSRSPISTGKHKSLVLLVDFPDLQFSMPDPAGYYDNFLNGRNFTENGATGSVWQYFYDNSGGNFDPEFTAAGPYRAQESYLWYDQSFDGAESLVKEILQQMAYEGFDFSPYADENGVVYDVFMIFSWDLVGDGLWPHMWYLDMNIGGYYFYKYAIACELYNNSVAGIGVFAHEYGHILSLPDYYFLPYNPGIYSLMSHGPYNNDLRTPAPVIALSRYMLGWIEPVTIETPGRYELPAIAGSNKSYIIRIGGEDHLGEYFTFETRGADTNIYDGWIGNSGLMATYANLSPANLDGDIYYLSSGHFRTIFSTLSGNISSEFDDYLLFPGMTNATTLSEDLYSGFRFLNGRSHGYELTDIAYADGKVSFNIVRTATGIYIEEQNIELFEGESSQLTVISTPDPGANLELTWSSSDNSVAEVSSTGLVTARSEGTATITAKVVGKNIKATTSVSVSRSIGGITPLYVYQNDAEFSWPAGDDSITGYSVEVTDEGGTVVFNRTLEHNGVYVPCLAVGKTHTLKVSAINGNELLPPAAIEFSTMPVVGRFAYMKIEGTYDAGEPVPMHIFDIQGGVASIEWKVDGEQATPPAVALPAGRHKITARVTTKDDKIEEITKFITVK